MSAPDVAVVIPTMRRLESLTRALRSVFAQESVATRLREIVVGQGEMVHPDVDVAGRREFFHGQLQQGQLVLQLRVLAAQVRRQGA